MTQETENPALERMILQANDTERDRVWKLLNKKLINKGWILYRVDPDSYAILERGGRYHAPDKEAQKSLEQSIETGAAILGMEYLPRPRFSWRLKSPFTRAYLVARNIFQHHLQSEVFTSPNDDPIQIDATANFKTINPLRYIEQFGRFYRNRDWEGLHSEILGFVEAPVYALLREYVESRNYGMRKFASLDIQKHPRVHRLVEETGITILTIDIKRDLSLNQGIERLLPDSD